ncbi:MAG: Nif3-like dinuclear metal center hexameric protein [Desulfobacula sp.]|nr:Nif3-like dinuclear metal center hexameric protein [Desulfobacula sp.]
MVTIADIIEQLNTFAPFDIAENWDNSGLQVGSQEWEVKKIIIALDVTMPLMEAAKACGANLVITHHPLMINSRNVIDFNTLPGRVIESCAKNRISIVSVHTNLDKTDEGLNDYFAKKIGILNISGNLSDDLSSMQSDQNIGIGRLGEVESELTLSQLATQVKKKLNIDHLRVIGDMTMMVKKIAICTGSGGSLLDDFFCSKADVYITGDIKYHEARKVEELSKGLIDVGHFGSEHMAIDLLYEKLRPALAKAGLKIEMVCFKNERDPFTIV